ncbi:MAG TPA: proline hydroxylase [Flavobacteriales bacterium]|jgi:hypothetical protein|nr:proline hydroxylase [Flavobacteriales bacterium]
MNVTDTILDPEWRQITDYQVDKYRNAHPFPHGVFESFLEEKTARNAESCFPNVSDSSWIHYIHFNERKHGLNKIDQLPVRIQSLINELNSDDFLKWLERLTGIEGLMADPMLEGGGLHQSQSGGFLNIHADFTVHPHHRDWERRVNLIVYLNDNWEEEWGGHLELWNENMTKREQRIAPLFNRAVIFNTTKTSYHGHPEPLKCPEDRTRRSLALYYYTHEKNPNWYSTNYQGRPDDAASKKRLIWLDKKMIATYTRLKHTLGIKDDTVSKILNRFGKK